MGAEGEPNIEPAQDNKVSKTSAEMEAWANQQGMVAEKAARASSIAEDMPGIGPSAEDVSTAVARGGLVSTDSETNRLQMTKATDRGLEVSTESSGKPAVELRSPSTIAEDAKQSEEKAA